VKLRVSAVDLMLLGAVLVRALDLTVTRDVPSHGIRIVATAVGLERLRRGFRLAALDRREIAGGIAIGLGIVLDPRRNGVPEPAVLGGMPAE
jgi:hypothetical protein